MLRACSIKVLGVVLLGTAVMVYIILVLVVTATHYSRGIHQSLVSRDTMIWAEPMIIPLYIYVSNGMANDDGYCIHGICTTMRANELLSTNGYY